MDGEHAEIACSALLFDVRAGNQRTVALGQKHAAIRLVDYITHTDGIHAPAIQ